MKTFEVSEHAQGQQVLATMLLKCRDEMCGEDLRNGVWDCLGVIKQNSLFHMANQAGPLAQSMTEVMLPEQPFALVQGKVTMMKEGKQLPYAWMEEKGGIIKPRPENRIQRLVWVGEDGRLIFARQVTHVGKNYMELGAKESLPYVREHLTSMIFKTFQVFE